MIRAIRMLNLHRIAEQKLRATLAVLAIAAGVSLTVAVLVDQASIFQSADRVSDTRAGNALLKVQGAVTPGGLDPAVVDRVAAVPGVAAVVPLVSAVTIAESAAGDEHYILALGVDCRIEALVGPFGCSSLASTAAGPNAPPLLSSRLAALLGDDGVVRTDVGPLSVRAAPALPQLDAFNDGLVAVLPLPQAQTVFARDRGALDLALVVPSGGADPSALRHAVEIAAGPHNVVAAANQGPPITLVAGPIVAGFLIIALIGLGIGAQLVYSVVSLTLEERRRDSAIVAALGGTRRLLAVGALVEAGTLGLVGGALGVVGGVLLARPLVESADDLTGRLLGIHVSVAIPVWVIAAGVAIGFGVAVLAALGPARRAARREVAAELHGAAIVADAAGRRSLRGMVAFVVAGLAGVVLAWIGQRGGGLAKWQPPVGFAGLGLVLAMTWASTYAGAAVFQRLSRFARVQRGMLKVALDNLASQPRRAGAMVVAVATATGMGVSLDSLSGGIPDAVAKASLSTNRILVSALPTQNSAMVEAKTTPSTERTLRALADVESVDPVTAIFMEHPSLGSVLVNGTDQAYLHNRLYLGDDPDAVLARGEVMIGAGLARRKGLRPGDAVSLPGRYGFVELHVGGVWNNADVLGNNLTVSLALSEQIWGRHAPTFLVVTVRPGADPAAVAARITDARIEPHLRAFDSRGLVDDITKEAQVFVTPFAALQRAMVFVALVAVMSTLLLVGVQRRREHAVMAAVGMSPRDLASTTLLEAGLVGAVGSVLGTMSGVVISIAVALMFPVVAGPELPLRVWLASPFIYGGIATAAVVLGAALPAWRVSRLKPAMALRYE